MQAIIKTNAVEFHELNNRINEAMLAGIAGYSAKSWCEPIVNTITEEYACVVEPFGDRRRVIDGVLRVDEQVVELSPDDVNWFPNNYR